MSYTVNSLDVLTEQFRKLPGIGKKSARRIAFHVLRMRDEDAQKFIDAFVDARKTVRFCPVCQNMTDSEICSICANPKRDKSTIMVVAYPRDAMAIEDTNDYNGTYHVLHGMLDPDNGVGPKELHVQELISRLADDTVKEVVIATSPTVEGDATAIYLSKLIKPLGITVTRPATGMAVGSDIEYTDEITLSKSIEDRSVM